MFLSVNWGVSHEHIDAIGLDAELAVENVIQKLLDSVQVLHKTSLDWFVIFVGFARFNSLVTKSVAGLGLRFAGAGLTCKRGVDLDGLLGNRSWDDAAGHVLT